MMSSSYVLTAKSKKILEKRFEKMLICYRCGEPLLAGDEVIYIRHSYRNNGAKRYHKRCFEEMFI